MRPTAPSRYLNVLVLALTLALTSCGGGTNTAGAGGSGVGGTGITTVTGNVSQVVARAPATQDPGLARSMLAVATGWLAAPAGAQEGSLAGIQVIGGGQSTTTDGAGEFELQDVTPSDNFRLIFIPEEDRTIVLPIGTVRSGARVRVVNVVLDTGRGVANADDVEVQEDVDDANSADDDNSVDDDQDSADADDMDDDDPDDDEEDDAEDDAEDDTSQS